MKFMTLFAVLLLSSTVAFSQQSEGLNTNTIVPNNGIRPTQTGTASEYQTTSDHNILTNNSLSVQIAPPANDNCANAQSLTVGAPCINGTTKQSTTQSGETFMCQGTPNQSVWYSFVATSTDMYVEVDWTASSGCYLSSAVYSGGCLPSTGLSCEDAAGGPFLNVHNLTGLVVGNTYYIQVTYAAGGPCGGLSGPGATTTGADFCINVGETVNCGTCNNPCGGMCIFATQPTVSQVTTNCTRYDLQPRMNAGDTRTQCYTFNSPGTSFSLQMIINSIGCSGGNVTNFQWNLYNGTCGGVIQSGNLSNLNATGLTVGGSYVLCYTWTAACEHNSVYPYMVATAPLPVELLHFDGKAVSDYIILNWATASEKNNDYFSVQRSNDGINYSEIGTVNGAGSSASLNQYEFVDRFPASGINYYRLVQFDFDHTATSSSPIAVRLKDFDKVELLQNTVTDYVQLSLSSSGIRNFLVYVSGPDGKRIYYSNHYVNAGSNLIKIPVSTLQNGMYFLGVEGSNGFSKFEKFIKF